MIVILEGRKKSVFSGTDLRCRLVALWKSLALFVSGFPSVKWGLIIRPGVPHSVPAESKAALYFIVYFARVKTRKQPPCSQSTLRALDERHNICTSIIIIDGFV